MRTSSACFPAVLKSYGKERRREGRPEFIDNIEREKRGKEANEIRVCIDNSSFFELWVTELQFQGNETRDSFEKVKKSERGMPGLPEARKDVVSCEKARGSANRK